MRICDKCIHDKVRLLAKSRAKCELFDEYRPHGEWEKKPEICYDYFYCSECGYAYKHAFNFCPNCGADMRKECEQNE